MKAVCYTFNPKRVGLIIILITFLSLNLLSKDYYFSSISGSDSNTGESPTEALASISRLNQIIKTLNDGDRVLLEKGSVWYQASVNLDNKKNITITSYGSGNNPVISGGINLSGRFTNEGNNIWAINNIGYSKSGYIHNPAGLLINNKFNRVARHPNNTYYSTENYGDNHLVDETQSWTDNELAGAQVAARCVNWAWSIGEISGNNSNTIYFDFFNDYKLSKKTYYFLQNYGLDSEGEWTYSNETLRVYSSSDLNSKNVEFPVTDTIFNITNCSNLVIENLEVRNANGILVNITDGSSIKITNSIFRVAGSAALDINKISDVSITNNYFEYTHSNGIIANDLGLTHIEHNRFKFTPGIRGMNNNYDRWGAAITNYYCNDKVYVRNNQFDSLGIAYHTHWSNQSWYFEKNIIRDYGFINGDIGAVYCGGDWKADVPKYIRKNIFKDAHVNLDVTIGGHAGNFVHSIYWDYDSRGMIADSNTMVNTNVAIFSNINHSNKARHNKIINAIMDVQGGIWANDIYLDALIDGTEGIRNYEFTNNLHVFGDVENTSAIGWHYSDEKPIDFSSCTVDHNIYQNPFRDLYPKAQREIKLYSVNGEYSTNENCNRRGMDCNSKFNPLSWNYDSVKHLVSKDEFVKVIYNTNESTQKIYFDNVYLDINGNIRENFITLEPFTSEVLFFYQQKSNSIQAPVLNDQQFEVKQTTIKNNCVATLIADQFDANKTCEYVITSGNNKEIFTVDETGNIFCSNIESIDFSLNQTYKLNVTLSYKESPDYSDNAVITLKFIEEQEPHVNTNQIPIIENQSFEIYQENITTDVIGNITAADSDNETLNYCIISGNEAEYFQVDHVSGQLRFKNLENDLDFITQNPEYGLEIMVTDNQSELSSDTALVTIVIVPKISQFYIDPENSNDPLEDGTKEHPYNTWDDVTQHDDGMHIMLKRGTTLSLDKIAIEANNITFKDYGEGNKPVVKSNSYDYVIESSNNSNIAIKNIEFIAENAISAIYLSGSESSDNTIEGCRVNGSEYGIRIMDGSSCNIKYSTFENSTCGIFSFASTVNIFYNIFRNTHTAINLGSSSNSAYIYNNVFVDNRKSITTDNAEMIVYNNIFYMEQEEDIAIKHSIEKLVSNHNLYYPERVGFIQIGDKSFDKLADIKSKLGLDINSIADDPHFIDLDNNDYHLSEISPAIDAGKYVGITKDLLGSTVPFGDKPDIGCKEMNTYRQNSTGGSTDVANPGSSSAMELQIYPNPNSGNFNVTHNDISDFNEIEILDITGKTIFQMNIESNTKEVNINLSQVKKGIYFLSLKNNFTKETRKMIIN